MWFSQFSKYVSLHMIIHRHTPALISNSKQCVFAEWFAVTSKEQGQRRRKYDVYPLCQTRNSNSYFSSCRISSPLLAIFWRPWLTSGKISFCVKQKSTDATQTRLNAWEGYIATFHGNSQVQQKWRLKISYIIFIKVCDLIHHSFICIKLLWYLPDRMLRLRCPCCLAPSAMAR